MDPQFNEADIVKCKYHPKRPISFVYCKQICHYPSRLACKQCVLKENTWEGFQGIQDVLNDPGVILKVKDKQKNGIYDLLNNYFNLLEQDPDEFISLFKKDIQMQISKLEQDLKQGTEKYMQFLEEIAKVKKQFMDVFGYTEFKQNFKDLLKVENYNYLSEQSRLEQTIQNFILQFKDQNNTELKGAYEKLKQMEQALQANLNAQPKFLSDFLYDFQRNTQKSVEILSQQLANQGVLMKYSNLCNSFYFFELIQRIKKNIFEPPKISLIFKASEHGMNGQSFWTRCSNQGPTLTICKSKNGYVFGGYTPCKWVPNVSTYQKDESKSSFLFSYTRKEIYPILSVDHAIYCYQTGNYGPTFGGGFNLNIAADFQSGYSKMAGQYYSNGSYKIENYSTHLMGDVTPQLVEMEVFAIE